MPPQRQLNVWQGNSFALDLRLATIDGNTKTPVDLTGSEIVFRAVWTGGSVRKSSTDNDGLEITDAEDGRIRLSLTVSETRALPLGEVRYEIERRIGDEQTTILYGMLKTHGWANDD